MFEVGFSEIVLILGLALLVLGPEKLPDLAAKIGRWTGRARAMARQFQAQLEQEVTLDNERKTNTQHNPTPHYPDTEALSGSDLQPMQPMEPTKPGAEPIAAPAPTAAGTESLKQ